MNTSYIEHFFGITENYLEGLIDSMRHGCLDLYEDQLDLYGALLCKKEKNIEVKNLLKEVTEYLESENFDLSIECEIVGSLHDYIRELEIEDYVDSCIDEDEYMSDEEKMDRYYEEKYEIEEQLRIEECMNEENEDYDDSYINRWGDEEIIISRYNPLPLDSFKKYIEKDRNYKNTNELAGFYKYLNSLERDKDNETSQYNWVLLNTWMYELSEIFIEYGYRFDAYAEVVNKEIDEFRDYLKREKVHNIKHNIENNIKKYNSIRSNMIIDNRLDLIDKLVKNLNEKSMDNFIDIILKESYENSIAIDNMFILRFCRSKKKLKEVREEYKQLIKSGGTNEEFMHKKGISRKVLLKYFIDI